MFRNVENKRRYFEKYLFCFGRTMEVNGVQYFIVETYFLNMICLYYESQCGFVIFVCGLQICCISFFSYVKKRKKRNTF